MLSGAIFAPNSRRRRFALPRPSTSDLKHKHPAEKGANQDQASEQAQAHEGQFARDRFDDVGGYHHFEAEQQRPTDANLVDVRILLGYRLPQLAIGGSRDANHDDQNAEDFEPAPDDADGLIHKRFERPDRIDIVHRAPPAGADGTLSLRTAPAILPGHAIKQRVAVRAHATAATAYAASAFSRGTP
jgi:hypothetical protein